MARLDTTAPLRFVRSEIMNAPRPKLLPLLCVLAACASWLFCVGPCAFGWFGGQASGSVGACDAGACSSCVDASQPAEQGGNSPACLASCQQLRIAVAPAVAKVPVWAGVVIGCLPSANSAQHAPVPIVIRRSALDTGPPFARSFAELVLQKSLLSHAPPRSA